MAQDVQRVFQEEGLDPSEYGLFCYDEWDEQAQITDLDSEGNEVVLQEYRPAGNRYGVRYEELLSFIIAAL
jgi:N-methylhydantoinase A/oxoprolinase/acetone carboxylase beta subunit